MEKKKIKLSEVNYDDLLSIYKDVDDWIIYLDTQLATVKKMEEGNI